MAITAQQVKELRDKTGAGMMDCKKALGEAEGNFEKAVEVLRKKGASVAAKRAERTASEGIVLTKLFNDDKNAAIVEVNCETDFVAKSKDFIEFANFILDTIVDVKPADIEGLLAAESNGKKVADELTSAVGKVGEKIEISRFALESTENGILVDYIHHGSKLGVLLKIDNVPADKAAEFTTSMKDVAMQIAAMKPLTVYRDDVPSEVIVKEIDIYKEVARKEGKPEQILEKIADGKMNKFYQENCLSEQVFVKDNSKKIGDIVSEFNAANEAEAKIVLFHRFHLSDENK
ncbi:MAG: translation elongation factor Ts [Bacteroidetes bacterium]|nr:translation elongation factor Ts [Bacteroidota bacterium]